MMEQNTAKLGFYTSLAAFFAAAGYVIVQLLQIGKVLIYPWDAGLIYGFSLAIAPSFLLAMLAVHYIAPAGKRLYSHAALIFAAMYATFAVLMYTVQLAVVIPASLNNRPENVLDATPHSLFWTIDALAYICMGLSTLFASFLFKTTRGQSWLKWFLMANGLIVPLNAFVYFSPHFSTGLLLLGSPWAITAPGSMLLLAIFFRRTAYLPNDNRNRYN